MPLLVLSEYWMHTSQCVRSKMRSTTRDCLTNSTVGDGNSFVSPLISIQQATAFSSLQHFNRTTACSSTCRLKYSLTTEMLSHRRWPEVERSKLIDILEDSTEGKEDKLDSCDLRRIFARRTCREVLIHILRDRDFVDLKRLPWK